MSRIYLDHNATTPICASARAAIIAACEVGNASSVHAAGRAGRAIIEDTRAALAALVGGVMEGVVFTSGGTEACNLALAVRDAPAGAVTRVLIGASEHAAVREPAHAQGLPCESVPVDADGRLELAALDALLADPAPALVAVMAANNETGTVQELAEIAARVRAHGSLFFCDAVQIIGKLPFDMGALGVDMASVSGHKFGAPMGVGALIMRDGLTIAPRQLGGGQELRRRAGSENIIGIAGLGAAVRDVPTRLAASGRLAELRDGLEARLAADWGALCVFSAGAPRLPNTSCFALPEQSAEHWVMSLDLAGIAVSAGAACSSGKIERSHVLAAMGANETAQAAAIRVSLAPENTADDIAALAAACAPESEARYG